MKRILSYALVRILLTIPTLLILLTIVFVVLRVMPGDPISSMLGGHASEQFIEQKKTELGLNKPILAQYLDYLGNLVRLDFGESMIRKEAVWDAIKTKLPATLELTVFAMLIMVAIGIPLGSYAARKRRSVIDYGTRIYANIVYCIPVFWMGLMFQLLFGLILGWFPIAGRIGTRVISTDFDQTGFYVLDTILKGQWENLGDVLYHLVLPSVTLAIVTSGIFVRLTRANMLDTLRSDYVLAARSRGIPERQVAYRHGLRNALIPVVTMLGLQFSLLLAGAVLTESTFSWPGMGLLLLERISLRDYPTVQGVIVVYALFVNLVSLLVDIIYSVVDPRVKY